MIDFDRCRVVGVRGKGYRGDIAVDDLEMINSPCALMPVVADPSTFVPKTTPLPPMTTTFSPSKLGCDFDQNNCEWTEEVRSRFVP